MDGMAWHGRLRGTRTGHTPLSLILLSLSQVQGNAYELQEIYGIVDGHDAENCKEYAHILPLSLFLSLARARARSPSLSLSLSLSLSCPPRTARSMPTLSMEEREREEERERGEERE